jgi:V/A-type H+-transporting ATPase subunit E
MTGTDRIINRIMEEAKNAAERNLADARKEAQSLIAAAEKEAAEKIASARAAAEAEAADLKRRMHAVANLEERKRMLKVRQDMVDAAFEAALEKAVRLPDKDYGELLKGFILNSVRDGECEILFNEADKKRLGEKFVKEVNQTLKGMGRTSALKLSADALNSRGGFILRYGNMEINSTLEIVMSLLRPRLEAEVAEMLFKA